MLSLLMKNKLRETCSCTRSRTSSSRSLDSPMKLGTPLGDPSIGSSRALTLSLTHYTSFPRRMRFESWESRCRSLLTTKGLDVSLWEWFLFHRILSQLLGSTRTTNTRLMMISWSRSVSWVKSWTWRRTSAYWLRTQRIRASHYQWKCKSICSRTLRTLTMSTGMNRPSSPRTITSLSCFMKVILITC